MVICGCSCTTVSQVFNEEQFDRHDASMWMKTLKRSLIWKALARWTSSSEEEGGQGKPPNRWKRDCFERSMSLLAQISPTVPVSSLNYGAAVAAAPLCCCSDVSRSPRTPSPGSCCKGFDCLASPSGTGSDSDLCSALDSLTRSAFALARSC